MRKKECKYEAFFKILSNGLPSNGEGSAAL